MLGGISGYEVTETTDEDADRVALIQKATQTFLRAKLLGCEDEWTDFSAAMVDDYAALGCLKLK